LTTIEELQKKNVESQGRMAAARSPAVAAVFAEWIEDNNIKMRPLQESISTNLMTLYTETKKIRDVTDQGAQAIVDSGDNTGVSGPDGGVGTIWGKGGGYTRSGTYYGISLPATDPFAIVAENVVGPQPLEQAKKSLDNMETELQEGAQTTIALAERIKEQIETSRNYYLQFATNYPAAAAWAITCANELEEQLNKINSSINAVQNISEEEDEKEQTERGTIGSRVKQRRRNPRYDTMDTDKLRATRQEKKTTITRKGRDNALMKRRMSAVGPGGGKLTVKAKKKNLFKKTKKKKFKKGKPRKHYKTRKHYKSKKQENIEKALGNLKI